MPTTPENNSYYVNTVLDSTAIRAIQAVSNGMTMKSSCFLVVRGLGKNGNYAGLGARADYHQFGHHHCGFGGQFSPVPAREELIYPEYLNADTNDEIVKGGAAEHCLRREGDRDLRGLQSLWLHGGGDAPLHQRIGQGGDESCRPRADKRWRAAGE